MPRTMGPVIQSAQPRIRLPVAAKIGPASSAWRLPCARAPALRPRSHRTGSRALALTSIGRSGRPGTIVDRRRSGHHMELLVRVGDQVRHFGAAGSAHRAHIIDIDRHRCPQFRPRLLQELGQAPRQAAYQRSRYSPATKSATSPLRPRAPGSNPQGVDGGLGPN